MKTNSSNSAVLFLSLCAAAAVLASQLDAQIASEALSPTDDTVQFQSDTNALWLVAADTNALAESLAVLQERVAGAVLPEKPDAILLAATNRYLENFEAGGVEAFWLRPDSLLAKGQYGVAPESGGMLQSLLVNNHLLNVNFADNNKSGLAAIGQSAGDYWNPYIKPGFYSWSIANLLWSDGITPSTADLTVTNAPGQWGSLFCVDPMYASYSYQEPGQGNIAVMLNQLPTDTYDFYVYATRASYVGAPVIQLKRAGVSLWTKGTTLWGNGWYSTYWDEHEQYVRFRNIAVNNQTITLEVYPDQVGYPSISGLQIVPSSAIPSEQPTITALLNVDFGGTGTPYKSGLAAVGLTSSDFWNACYHPNNRAASVPNLKWSNQSESYAGMTVLNASGSWGNSLPDPMFRTYMYATDGGNTTITLTNLPSGIGNVYLYGHTPTADDNAVFELWSDDVNWGTKGTSIIGPGPTYATWEVGQQYVVFKDVTVTVGKPVIIHASHTKYGYNNLCGMQIAYTGAADTDADGLPDGWEQRCFNNLDQLATADPDADGLGNLREYQLGTDPTRTDSNANGISDLNDFERVWIEDAVPQGGYQFSAGGDTWNWVTAWSGGGWGGQPVYPHSGSKMHMSAYVPNAMHEHYFNRSLAVMRPAVGDVIYAYVNLDSSFQPSEVMLQFYTVENNGIGSWDHRAYWGANTINLGVNGTASRYPMGALPVAGQWVRLEVPASAVGLEGKIIAGLRFTLYGGRAAWDSAGTMKPDYDGDALPDWWEWQHFGTLVEGPNGDYDEDGVTNLDEYEAETDPNTIRFSTLFENLRVNSSSANGTVTVISGVAAKLAVLVDSTDFAAASWATYDSSFIANLGSAEGPHEVWVGLKGRADTSVATWVGYVLTRDTTPPTIVITNPVVSTVYQPLLQLQGYSPEPLASLRYDVANAAGTLTGLEGYVVKQFVDPDTLEITTNWFDCVDIELTNGLNTITVFATDDAGNMSTTVLNFEFALPTTPPTVVVDWPQDGQQISGTSFTVRGRSSDATASVFAEVVGGGETKLVEGIVERDGRFWIEDVPLANGENTVNLSVTDVAANNTMTTFTVVKSSVVLTIDPVHESFLNQAYVTVTGTINVSDHKVWVNGVEATLNGDGTWTAEEVPMTDGGTAVIQARAIPITDNGGSGTGGSGGAEATLENPGNPTSPLSKDAEADPEKPWELVLIHYHKALIETSDRHPDPGEEEPYKEKRWSTIRWDLNQPGHEDYNVCWGKASAGYYTWGDANWDKKGKGFAIEGLEAGAGVCGIRGDPDATYPINAWTAWPSEYCSVSVPPRERNDGFHVWTDTRTRVAKTLYELRTGGKGESQRKSVFVFSATASTIRNPWWPEWESNPDAVDVAPPNIVIGNLGALGSDSRLYQALRDNKTYNVTPKVWGNPYYVFYGPTVAKHEPTITGNGTPLDPDEQNEEFCVGQQVTFALTWNPPLDYVDLIGQWKIPPKFVNESWQAYYDNGEGYPIYYGSVNYRINDALLVNTNETTCWFVNGSGGPVSIGVSLRFANGQNVAIASKGNFKIYRPRIWLRPFDPGETERYYTLPFENPISCKLKLGEDDSSGGEMRFGVNINSKYPGAIGLTQLITANYPNPVYNFSEERCDGSEFYDGPNNVGASSNPNIATGLVNLSDGPWSIWTSPNWVDLSCRDFVRFQPNGGIWVTLGIVTWETVGIAQMVFEDWYLTDSATSGPNGPDSSDEFPVWTINQGGIR